MPSHKTVQQCQQQQLQNKTKKIQFRTQAKDLIKINFTNKNSNTEKSRKNI